MDGDGTGERLGGWERKRIRTSLNIELVALRLIEERGLDQVTVDQVATAAGISIRTFYRYFLNVPDVLTGVAKRQTDLQCQMILDRPPGEGIFESFRATFEDPGDALPPQIADVFDQAAEALELWGEIVRRDPDDAALRSHAVSYMTARYEEVIRARVDLPPDDDTTAGVLAAALAGVIWFVYVRWVEGGRGDSLYASLDDAFERLRRVMEQPPASNRRAG